MLKENEKRIFWIVVMAVSAVSVVSTAITLLVTNIEWLTYYEFVDIEPSLAAIFAILFAVGYAVNLILELVKRKYDFKCSLIWFCVLCGIHLVATIVFFVLIYDYSVAGTYFSVNLSLILSYAIAFCARTMLSRKHADETTADEAQQDDVK